ncbi:MAG: LysR family transcriptional regulator [Burkholderiales bacterium]|jgi:LysR family nitrogen assimilation transcriptional regulator|uniref:LysR family transcriptional regulator n=1 Tax=Candidatus Desulfobacillus denitrificans TaxID=2608985 RepID=A0A809QZ28_9PROT|nr:LysR family transcriptional regulator [Rhodocyclaceae bacterium]MCZ2173399.1 LysR family transcriptional regulator [Burkholderiales bacterium]OQY72683.1 MAG: LysR family transcriptional regulator [Rhodocyclaceae bacterium UTPRO2]BBO20649.1 LysR family transcriptional regulator [Candidatus Desulfobacillus denitrificans]GIK44217.1 MAG: transcriptional regulator [Betaproteobacteria bacterium]
MNLKQLEYFVAVAELGSFSKAAVILNIAQPALSRQVRLLETGLHVTLLMRNGRGAVLTEAGKRLFDHSVGILQLVSRTREDIEASRDEPAGRIVVGLPPSMGRLLTLPLVEGFRRSLPKARLAIVEGLSAHLAEWISTGRADIGLLHNPEPQPALEVTPVLEEPLGLVSPAKKGDPKPGAAKRGAGKKVSPRDTATLAELARLPLILPERTHAMRKLLETQAALCGHKLNVALEVSSVQSILDLVRAGHGHALLTPSALAASGDAAAFRLRPLSEPRLTSTLCLAVSALKPATPLSKHVFRMLRELVVATAAAHNKSR